jgi:alpha-ketoglutaric semialdehyde dehydrogenase
MEKTLKRYDNYIGGVWTPPESGLYLKNLNPADYSDVVGEFAASSPEDVRRAVLNAHEAFQIWGRMTPPQRESYLLKFIGIMERRNEEIGMAITRESGKPLREALGEPLRGVEECRFLLGEGRRMEGLTLPSDRAGVMSMAHRVPLGATAAITPWNFPFLTPLRKIVPALVFGNTVVFKPAQETPLSGVLILEMFEEAGLPPGVVNLVSGRGSEIGDALSGNPLIRGITFTGSTVVGSRICRAAAENFTPTQLEMGGKNPALVADYRNLDYAASQINSAAMALAGQRCTSISRVIVLETEADELERLLKEKVQCFVPGRGTDPQVTLGPVINASAGEAILDCIRGAAREGAEIAAGGNRITGGDFDRGFYIEPTLITGVSPEMRIASEEVFGPVLAVIRARDFDEAIRIANDTPYGLAASLFSDDPQKVYAFLRDVEAGMLHINHGTVTDSGMPFGGVKNSGMGPFSKGRTNREFFTRMKVAYTRYC